MPTLLRRIGLALALAAWIFVITLPLMSFAVSTRAKAGIDHGHYLAIMRVDERKLQDPILVLRSAGFRFALSIAVLGCLGLLLARGLNSDPGRRLRALCHAPATAVAGAWRRLLDHRLMPRIALAALGVLLLLIPPLLEPFGETQRDKMLDWAIWIGIWSILASGLNITVGMAGLLVLGYSAFYGIGAYTFAILSSRVATAAAQPGAGSVVVWMHESGMTFWISIPLAAAIAALFGLLLGLPSLRLRGDYLAIVTLGFGETIRYVLKNCPSLTGGENGIDVRALGAYPSLFGIRIDSQTDFYYLILALVVATVFLVSRLNHSRIGRAWIALREDEVAAEAMGVPTRRMKLLAFSLSAIWGGIAGVFFVRYQGFVNPESFTFNDSVLVLSMVVLGGMGSNIGVVLGAAILYSIPRFLRDFSGTFQEMGLQVDFSDYRLLIFGLIMVLMMIFRPQGILGGQRRRIELEAAAPRCAPVAGA